MSGITNTFAGGFRLSAKDRIAELGTGAIAGESQPWKQASQGGAAQDAADAPQGLAA